MKNLDALLDDRLAIVGTSGSGKTYGAKTLAERLLDSGARICIVDPLGVWWGLRSNAAGDGPGYPVVVFGSKHGDVPIDEASGAALAELIASSDFPAIIDLSELPSQTKRRHFMRDFAETLYAKNSRSLHLILDEADLWAPQKPIGPAAQILGSRIDEIVRRGRVRGFIPWLITQRPAVIHKDVLSQLDVLIAMKLVSSQDRNALDAWIEGQADKADQKRIIASLPKLSVGNGIVWAPGHSILVDHAFPKIKTFDSSKTPKRGERIVGPKERAAVNLDAIRAALATVQAETAANDPAALRKRIADLEKQVGAPAASNADLARSRQDGYQQGYADGRTQALASIDTLRLEAQDTAQTAHTAIRKLCDAIWDLGTPAQQSIADVAQPVEHLPSKQNVTGSNPVVRSKPPTKQHAGINGPQQRILDALAWWASVGIHQPSRIQVSVIARYSPSGGAFQNPLGGLRMAGFVEYPSGGTVALTHSGQAAANYPDAPATVAEFHDRLQAVLNGPQWRILAPIIDAYPKSISRADVAAKAGYEPTGGAFQNPLGSLRTLGLISYPGPGLVQAQPILFIGGAQ